MAMNGSEPSKADAGRRRRILFFAEAVTLAHVARPIVLAQGLDPDRHEIVIACDRRYQRFVERDAWQNLLLDSISSARFLGALEKGAPVYDVETLRRYVKEDLGLIDRVQPDLIVGDFRLSLSVSARLARVPYATVTNVYWSPFYSGKGFPLPVLPMTKVLPLAIAGWAFRLAQPIAFGLHCRPLNSVRQENGLPPLGNDLRRVYTDADHVLYADAPTMFPTENLPTSHRYLGPILWSPAAARPSWWDSVPTDRPIIYVTLGSSGQTRVLQTVLDALADMPVTLLTSTAGAAAPPRMPANAYVSDYLPGVEAAMRSSLVVCNGGSLTCQQALAASVPVLGIASNMDQFLNMEGVVRVAAGTVLRADRIAGAAVREAVTQLLSSSSGRSGDAERLAQDLRALNAPRRFADLVDEVLSP